ncbi:BA75_02830T0 [Komagataella pastoris]|uniref:BA75_02830T0 n=1 Tax=Komagataella pastoris TaxID=4922 RepID=A0A1B2JCC5_PICPA|nr:BA75_02830T0 [Komagataella pastoris]
MSKMFHDKQSYLDSWTFQNPSTDSLGSSSSESLLDRACSTSNLKLLSNYWKVPSSDDSYNYLTAFDVHNDKPNVAIASGLGNSNLLIGSMKETTGITSKYHLNHHQSITLPNIHSLKWLNNSSPGDFDFLLSGHVSGYVNLTIIPDKEDCDFKSAEIIKRFNHEKHMATKDQQSNIITSLELSPRTWKSCNLNSMFTVYKDKIFMWDCSRSRAPILMNHSAGSASLHPSPFRDGILGVAGKFGIALNDLRIGKDSTPSYFVPKIADRQIPESQLVKWSDTDSNILASSHGNVVMLWDVRMNDTQLAILEGHNDEVTSLEWGSNQDLYSGSKDGGIVHWGLDLNLLQPVNKPATCTLKDGLSSIRLRQTEDRSIVEDLVSSINCGTFIPASNSNIVELAQIQLNGRKRLLSIDDSLFLGMHDTLELTERMPAISEQEEDEISSSDTVFSNPVTPQTFYSSSDTLVSAKNEKLNFDFKTRAFSKSTTDTEETLALKQLPDLPKSLYPVPKQKQQDTLSQIKSLIPEVV